MSAIRTRLMQQFKQPHGALGHLAGWIMANRPSNRQRNLWTLDLLELDPAAHILEVGFGPGFGISAAARRVPYGKVYGVDHSHAMLEQASRRCAAEIHAGRVELHRGVASDLGWLHERVDRIWSNNVVQFLPDLHAAFTSFHGALKPGGSIATTYQPRNPGASATDCVA